MRIVSHIIASQPFGQVNNDINNNPKMLTTSNGNEVPRQSSQSFKANAYRSKTSKMGLFLNRDVVDNNPTTNCVSHIDDGKISKYFYPKMIAGDSSCGHSDCLVVSDIIGISGITTKDTFALNVENSEKSGSDHIGNKNMLSGAIFYGNVSFELDMLKSLLKKEYGDDEFFNSNLEIVKKFILNYLVDTINATPFIRLGRNYSVECCLVECMNYQSHNGWSYIVENFYKLNTKDRTVDNSIALLKKYIDIQDIGNIDGSYKTLLWTKSFNSDFVGLGKSELFAQECVNAVSFV